MIERKVDGINLKIFDTREEMGSKAAEDARAVLKKLLSEKEEINLIFAAAPSQSDFLGLLADSVGIDWSRVNVFHMDEYIGLEVCSKRSFSGYLENILFHKLNLKSKNFINGMADPEEECIRYSELINKNEIDIVFMGIGENGHIAFNDPAFADFDDKKVVKIVNLDEVSRNQQVHDGCFEKLDDVPKTAITLTIPMLISGKQIFCIVPSRTKAEAVRNTLEGEISESCPASILRTIPNVHMYIDSEAASLI